MDEIDSNSEFYKHILLKQWEESLIYMRNCTNFIYFLDPLLKIPGNDPTKDSITIYYRYSIHCILNRMLNIQQNPGVPIDYSTCHPALTEIPVLLDIAKNHADQIIDLNENFPYEFYKTLSKLNNEQSLTFCLNAAQNLQLPLNLVGRIISIFPLKSMSFDFWTLFQSRCQNFETLSLLYEGLMCGISSKQLESAELQSDHSDPFLGEDALLLANTSTRLKAHFVDTSGSLCKKLFKSFSIVNFLMQADFLNPQQMLRQIHLLPDHPIKRKFQNQLILSQVLGLGSDWEVLKAKSIPAIITPEFLSAGLLTIPREADFVLITKADWATDFDFIQAYIAMKEFFESETLLEYPNTVAEDMFSLLFIQCNNKYITNFDLAKTTLKSLSESDINEVSIYAKRGLQKVKAAELIFEKPEFKDLLLPTAQYFTECKTEQLKEMMDIFPEFSNSIFYSKIFREEVMKFVVIEMEPEFSFFGGFNPQTDIKLNEHLKELLKDIPEEHRENVLLDISFSNNQFISCSDLIDSERSKKIIEKLNMFKSIPQIPISFTENRINLHNKCASFFPKIPDGFLKAFLKYFIQFESADPTRSLPPQEFMGTAIHQARNLSTLKNVFEGTNIIFEQFIFGSISPQNIQKGLLREVVKENPLPGLLYANNILSKEELIENIQSPILKKYFTEKDISGDILCTSDLESYKKYIPELLESIRKMPEDDGLSILEDLVYQFDLEEYYGEILAITKPYGEKARGLIETLSEILPQDSPAIIPLWQRLDSLLNTKGEWSEIEQLFGDTDKLFNDPALIYMKTRQHLANNSFGVPFVRNVQRFARILIISRSLSLFSNQEEEKEFILKTIGENSTNLKGVFSSISNELIIKLIIEIAITTDIDAMKGIAATIPDKELIRYIRPKVAKNPKIVRLISNQAERDNLINSVLRSINVKNSEADDILIKTLRNLRKELSPESTHLCDAILSASVDGLWWKLKESFDTRDLQAFANLLSKYDFKKSIKHLQAIGVKLNNSKFNESLRIFGIAPSDLMNPGTLISQTEIDSEIANSMFENIKVESKLPSLFELRLEQKVFSVYRNKPRRSFVLPIKPDFSFFDISTSHSISLQGRIYTNCTAESKKQSFSIDSLEESLNEAISQSNLCGLFDSLNEDQLYSCLVFLESHSCLFAILQMSVWALDRKQLSVFGRNNKLEGNELLSYVKLLKETLADAADLRDSFDPSLLITSGSITEGERKALEDISVVLQYQRELGRGVSLLTKQDKGSAVAQLLKSADYDNAFALTRALDVDISDAMIEAAAFYGQQSNRELGEFLVNVIPRLSVENANSLIETLASILVGNKIDDSFVRSLIGSISEPSSSFAILEWFGFSETSAFVAMQNGLRKEVSQCEKEARRRRDQDLARVCHAWLSYAQSSID